MSIQRYKVLYDSATAGNSEWFALDTRYQEADITRYLNVNVTSGDTVTVQGILEDAKGIDKSFLDALSSGQIVEIVAVTGNGQVNFTAPYSHIRIVKSGTNGRAFVEGFI